MRNIRQNLFFALAYNTIGIPLAAGILYPVAGIRLSPIIAAAATALSSLSVVGNANRLRRWQPAPLPAARPTAGTPKVRVGTAHDDIVETTKSQQRTQEETTMQRDHKHVDTAQVIDPVCGMTVDPATAAATREDNGKTYYFCSTHCASTFDADRARYVG
jgi:Cu+-exporting ATPase